ncbi:Got1 protein [Pichia kluyveri]|uniref:Got1 protein n=1 Tax=Pichia kluyveri TaxID=36015 RepID=A0AAV5R7P2_PICKL|nr:Got1 protein [Pichia kluyveri]
MLWLTQTQKMGVFFSSAGAFLFILGIMSFFDSALLSMANILFLVGIALLIGPQRTLYFFSRRQKIRGSIMFALGILLIFLKHPFIGFIFEMFGMLALFGEFFATMVQFLRSVPIIGPFLSNPMVAPIVDKVAGIRVLPI